MRQEPPLQVTRAGEVAAWHKPTTHGLLLGSGAKTQARDPGAPISSVAQTRWGSQAVAGVRLTSGEAGCRALGSISYLAGQGREGGCGGWQGRGGFPRVPRAHHPPSAPSTWSACVGSLHTAQLENVTSLERFPRALPGPSRRARPPRLIFLRQPRSLPERGAPARAGARPRAPGALLSRARSEAGGSAAGGPIPPASRPGAARAYLCGPGRSRGRHPVV